MTKGSNIPGKPIEALNFAGGVSASFLLLRHKLIITLPQIPVYIKEIGRETNEGYPGRHRSVGWSSTSMKANFAMLMQAFICNDELANNKL